MPCSEARLAANKANASKSTGPKTECGRGRSRLNGLKHGLTGRGIVVHEGDAEEIQARFEAFRADMRPRSPAGLILIRQMATLSVRAERAAVHESAQVAMRVRHAADDFDAGRVEEADRLFEALGDDPRANLRRLRRFPEGVDRLIDGWLDLRNDLTADPKPIWTALQMEQAANLVGLKIQHARASRLGALFWGSWGDFEGLGEQDGGGLDDEPRQAWARAALLERIDAEIAALEARFETLDFEMIELDRAEAGERALFDPSKEASLARRYESEASRGFLKALKEFRQVEAESEAMAEADPAPAPVPPAPAPTRTSLGSCRESTPTADRGPAEAPTWPPSALFPPLRDAQGRPSGRDQTLPAPG